MMDKWTDGQTDGWMEALTIAPLLLYKTMGMNIKNARYGSLCLPRINKFVENDFPKEYYNMYIKFQ